jgi:hypothetical protein
MKEEKSPKTSKDVVHYISIKENIIYSNHESGIRTSIEKLRV